MLFDLPGIRSDTCDILLRTHRLTKLTIEQHSQQENSCQDPFHEELLLHLFAPSKHLNSLL